MTTVVERILRRAERVPATVAITHVTPKGATDITWGEFADSLFRWGGVLKDLEGSKGRPVLIFLPHSHEMYFAYFGAMAGGLIPSYMPLPSAKQEPGYYWASHRTLVDRIKPAAIIAPDEIREDMVKAGIGIPAERILTPGGIEALAKPVDAAGREAMLAAIGPEDIALLQHTSGTTGLKKGVALSHGAIILQSEAYSKSIDLDESGTIVSWLPLYHDMGLIACLMGTVLTGNRLVNMDPFHWLNRPGRLFELAQTHGGSHIWLPNFAFDHLVNTVRKPEKFDLSGIKAFVSCSEVSRPQTARRFVQHFEPAGVTAGQCAVSYAMAETVFAVTQTPMGRPFKACTVPMGELGPGDRVRFMDEGAEDSRELMSCGPVLPGVTVRIVDPERNEVEDGVVGEVEIQAPFLFSGYFALPEKTAEKLRDGKYYSSDLGFKHDGEIFILGRADDMVILNGKNIFANEVEQSLQQIEGLKPGRIVATGVDDARLGSQRLVVMAELKEDVVEDRQAAISDEVSEKVSREFGVDVADVWLVPLGALHKTTSGKISRHKNREYYVANRRDDEHARI
ncbi:AMP-binding protein [Zavarzinia compransoris]|uniref:AMP-binding protein n=1 Tax=Zavarzinia marina TaxID=2911065 RepID=UPI001F39130E|nr:AMP-binding protein [Zavarzinia marina]MCF4167276.1 AMP-binding protein [Zavarzinia marina]